MDFDIAKDLGQTAAVLIIAIGSAVKWWNEHKLKKNKPDLADDDYDDLIGGIMQGICDKVDAYRTAYWAFTNGTKTGDGYSLKYFSVMVEKNRPGVSSVLLEMQNLPVAGFKRNMIKLKATERFILTDETKETDELSKFHAAYNVKTALFFKINTNGRWNGILGITFDTERIITAEEEAWLLAQVGRIEHEIFKMNK
jgi:hypothetical protein